MEKTMENDMGFLGPFSEYGGIRGDIVSQYNIGESNAEHEMGTGNL